METLDAAMIAVIDQRIKTGAQQGATWGTVSSVTSDTDVLVTFDGTDTPLPVKLGGDVWTYEGDRVGLLLIGKHWTVVTSMVRRWPANAGMSSIQTNGTTASGSFVTVPTPITATFTKRWAGSQICALTTGSARTDTNNTGCEIAVQFTADTGTITVLPTAWIMYNVASQHGTFAGVEYLSGLAAGTYTASVQWRRTSGSGTLFVDNNDRMGMSVAEVSP